MANVKRGIGVGPDGEPEEYLEIAGMRYRREPAPGEYVCIDMTDSDMLGVYVKVGADFASAVRGTTIAWDQIEKPPSEPWLSRGIQKRTRLAHAAAKHWRERGFDVTLTTLDDF